jgi:hypothetical protein
MPLIQVGGYRSGQRAVEPVFAEVDDDDYERCAAFRWSQNKDSSKHTIYAQRRVGDTWIHMHRFIMGLPPYRDDKRIIDHKDGNGLNNKKENLTICDTLYNSQSYRAHHGARNFGHVYYDSSMTRIKRWKAAVVLDGVRQQQRFELEADARAWIESLRPTRD